MLLKEVGVTAEQNCLLLREKWGPVVEMSAGWEEGKKENALYRGPTPFQNTRNFVYIAVQSLRCVKLFATQ